jgi:hypothetical protein
MFGRLSSSQPQVQLVSSSPTFKIERQSPIESGVMSKVKLFKSIESELLNMETEINDWINTTGARVISITGNIAPQTGSGAGAPLGSFSASDVLIVIMYEDGNAR